MSFFFCKVLLYVTQPWLLYFSRFSHVSLVRKTFFVKCYSMLLNLEYFTVYVLFMYHSWERPFVRLFMLALLLELA